MQLVKKEFTGHAKFHVYCKLILTGNSQSAFTEGSNGIHDFRDISHMTCFPFTDSPLTVASVQVDQSVNCVFYTTKHHYRNLNQSEMLPVFLHFGNVLKFVLVEKLIILSITIPIK
jgi:hypothetical protein